MIVYNFGSINIDHVYRVSHFVRPGETMTSDDYQQILGGKGANQSIALGRAGCQVNHVGVIATADQALLKTLKQSNVDVSQVALGDVPTGHAIIQVNQDAENAIVLFAGANHQITPQQIDQVLSQATSDDWVLLQNETNNIDLIISRAKHFGLSVAFNPAPMDAQLVKPLIKDIDLLIVNEVEAMDLCGVESVAEAQAQLQQAYPELRIMLTLGSQGVRYLHQDNVTEVSAYRVEAVDTTAAGDTFIGYALAGLNSSLSIEQTLRRACAASALCVMSHGASSAIPNLANVNQFMEQQDA
ncbi:MAG: ribokinase [Psychrobium sp.]